MEIKDLFSHKIHSSSDDWSNKLIDIATIFAEFDGLIYDRLALRYRLNKKFLIIHSYNFELKRVNAVSKRLAIPILCFAVSISTMHSAVHKPSSG